MQLSHLFKKKGTGTASVCSDINCLFIFGFVYDALEQYEGRGVLAYPVFAEIIIVDLILFSYVFLNY